MSALEPRGYQAEALQRTAKAEADGVRRQLGVAATGLGKTVIFAMLAQQRGGRTLVLVHRDELVRQAVAKLGEVWPGVQVGVVKAGENDVHAQVVVASVQTLARPTRLRQLLAPFADNDRLLGRADPFDLVVVDEAHHAAADSYRTILDALRAGQPEVCTCSHGRDQHAVLDYGYSTRGIICCPSEFDQGIGDCPCMAPEYVPAGPLLLGVTATPDRGDGKGLDDTFDQIVWSYDMLWGIRSGYLSDVRGMRVTIDRLDLSGVKVRHGDYEAGAAGRAMEDADAPDTIVRAWLVHAAERRTLVFTPTVALAETVCDEFRHSGVAAGWVHGGTPMDERRALLRAYSSGDVQVLVNCAVLTEGYDEPRTDCIVVARPTKSRALYTQMVGRGTRRHPDKTDLLVLDVVGATAVHSLVTVPSLFGLGESAWADPLADGTALLSAHVDAWEQEQVRVGRLRADEVELFHALRGEGIAWVQVHQDGDRLRRYVRQLGKDQDGKQTPTVVLAQRTTAAMADPGTDPAPELWTAGLLHTDGTKHVLMADVPMELAQGVAEDYVRKNAHAALTDPEAAWRQRKPSPKALAAAEKWRLPVDPGWSAGQLSDALGAHIARKKDKSGSW